MEARHSQDTVVEEWKLPPGGLRRVNTGAYTEPNKERDASDL